MSIMRSIFGRCFLLSPFFSNGTAFSVSLTGLTGGYAIIGSHASIGYTIDPDNGTDTVKWSNSSDPADPATYGTGAAPTDYTAGDGNPLYCHVTDGAETVTRSATIAYAAGTAPVVADGQSWVVDDTAVNIDASASGSNLTFSYVMSGEPAGSDLTINSGTGAITGTLAYANVGSSGSGTVTVTATDQYGRTYQDTFTYSYALRAQATGGADLDLSFPEDSAITPTDLTANWTANGNTLTYAITGTALPTGLSVSSAGSMTGTPTTVTADDTYTLRGTDEYGRFTDDTFTLEITAALAAPVVSSSSYNASTGEVTMAINSAAGDCTVYWATTASGATPTEAQVRAGTGGGILDAGSFTSSAPSDTDAITATDTTAAELHFVVENAAGDTGTPSGGNNTVITGVVVYPTPSLSGTISPIAAPSSSSDTFTVDMEPGMNVISIYGMGQDIGTTGTPDADVTLDGNNCTRRCDQSGNTSNRLYVFEYFNAGPKKTGVTLQINYTSTPLRLSLGKIGYFGNVAFVSGSATNANGSQVNDVGSNASAGDMAFAASWFRTNTKQTFAVTGELDVAFDAVAESNRYHALGVSYNVAAGTPIVMGMDMGETPPFEHYSTGCLYRPN